MRCVVVTNPAGPGPAELDFQLTKVATSIRPCRGARRQAGRQACRTRDSNISAATNSFMHAAKERNDHALSPSFYSNLSASHPIVRIGSFIVSKQASTMIVDYDLLT
jgi:hypothetical protein